MTDDTRWLSTEESAAWVRLVALAELLPGALDAQLLRDAQVTHFEYAALMALALVRNAWAAAIFSAD